MLWPWDRLPIILPNAYRNYVGTFSSGLHRSSNVKSVRYRKNDLTQYCSLPHIARCGGTVIVKPVLFVSFSWRWRAVATQKNSTCIWDEPTYRILSMKHSFESSENKPLLSDEGKLKWRDCYCSKHFCSSHHWRNKESYSTSLREGAEANIGTVYTYMLIDKLAGLHLLDTRALSSIYITWRKFLLHFSHLFLIVTWSNVYRSLRRFHCSYRSFRKSSNWCAITVNLP